MSAKLSVVIAAINGTESLAQCLESFRKQTRPEGLEIIVPASCSKEEADKVRTLFPEVKLLHFTERKSIPELRAVGLLQASGDILAMTEDHCLADEHWAECLLDAHRSPHLVIGGAVENAATERLVDWAVYFCEYGRYMQPIQAGPTDDLPGPNVSYKREALEMFRDLLEPATWEPFWHWRLMSRGVELINDPGVVIYHKKHFTFRGFLSERYYYARSFAGRRVEGVSSGKRLLFIATAPLLPPLLLWRIARRVLAKRRHRRELALSLPYISIFTLSWSLGEFMGYAFGPGDSQSKIE